ncbi:hypothetical protein [Agromyces humi]|uniref:hypothetical protein n=1 Tax=Agromyces humi TaxID=1766800 RepID=UPI001357F50F|nr:hypothetical protein [Agromyces humi]
MFDLTWRDLQPHEVHDADTDTALGTVARKAYQQERFNTGDSIAAFAAAANAGEMWIAARSAGKVDHDLVVARYSDAYDPDTATIRDGEDQFDAAHREALVAVHAAAIAGTRR